MTLVPATTIRVLNPRVWMRCAWRVAAAGALLGGGSGCQSMGILDVWRAGMDKSMIHPITDEEAGSQGTLMQRWLRPRKASVATATAGKGSGLVLGPGGLKPPTIPPNPKAESEFRKGEKLFRQGKFEEAEPIFAKLAKDYKGLPWGEKGQFYLAQSYYEHGKLMKAYDAYNQLMVDNNVSEYVDKVTAKLYAIARTWLASIDPKAKPEDKLPFQAHFDGRAPVFDQAGFAIQALEKIQQYDPTGPLADVALITMADYYMQKGDYEAAAMHYDELIASHPKSQFLQRAQQGAIEAYMNSYMGPGYDISGLEKARERIRQTLKNFPERPASSQDKLIHTLDVINDAEAQKDYSTAEFYDRTGNVPSAEFYYGKVTQRWPQSEWAAKSKTKLADLAKKPRKSSLPSMIQPALIDPFASVGSGSIGSPFGGNGMMNPGMGGMMGPGGMM